MSSFSLKIDGFESALSEFGSEKHEKIAECARIAINDTVRWALKHARDDMNKNVAFPSGYLDNEDRLSISNFASNSRLEASIDARAEATSLARFALDSGTREGVMVHVKNENRAKLKRGAFLWGLKRGSKANGNVGLVVRSKGKPSNAYKPKAVGDKWPDLWLLYGPSVYQVLRQSMSRLGPQIQDKLAAEFDRQLDLRVRKK